MSRTTHTHRLPMLAALLLVLAVCATACAPRFYPYKHPGLDQLHSMP